MHNQPTIIAIAYILGLTFQILVLSQVQFLGYLTPYYYPALLLLLPPTTNQHLLLIMAFFTGLLMDIFEQTGAIHASALVMMVYLRPVFLRLVSTQSGRELGKLTVSTLGLKNFSIYIFIPIFMHHIVLYFLDSLSFYNLDIVFFRALQTSILSFFVITMIHGLIAKTKLR
ncbi:MAG: hypothetical protein JJU02_08550 [Cryomorphaceae bacterium]|nr:hypothetical protein [Cryomorphaceae bacterium]